MVFGFILVGTILILLVTFAIIFEEISKLKTGNEAAIVELQLYIHDRSPTRFQLHSKRMDLIDDKIERIHKIIDDLPSNKAKKIKKLIGEAEELLNEIKE